MKKKNRQEKLLEIINSYEIDTQEDLVKMLNDFGYNVTQATISRDIKELNIVKVTGRTQKYKYAIMPEDEPREAFRLYNLFKVCVAGITVAQNLVVVKTLIGNAMAAATAIDKMKIPEIIGCVSGDDTIIIVTKNNDTALMVEEKLREQL